METHARKMVERHCSAQSDAASSASHHHHQLLQPQSTSISYASDTDTTGPAGALMMSHPSTGDRSRGSHLKLRRHIKGTWENSQLIDRKRYTNTRTETFALLITCVTDVTDGKKCSRRSKLISWRQWTEAAFDWCLAWIWEKCYQCVEAWNFEHLI